MNEAVQKRGLGEFIVRLAQVGLLVSFVFSLTGFLGEWHYVLELTSHFPLQYGAAQLLALVVMVLGRRKAWAIVTLLFLCMNATLVFLPSVPTVQWQQAGAPEGLLLTAMVLNVETGNDEYGLVSDYIQACQADVVGLVEVNETWLQKLDSALQAYPYKVTAPRSDNFGMALYSKLPLQKQRVVDLGNGVPSIVTELHAEDADVSFALIHPDPPMQPSRFHDRNAVLDAVAKRSSAPGTRWIVAGDFNCTPWSPYFRKLLREGRLTDSRRGQGPQPSWPVGLPYMWIPIDHCLHSPEILTVLRELGPDVGSDHYPVFISMFLPKVKKASANDPK